MNDRIINVLMVGVGGQGIITASDILSRAALYSGYDVKKSEIHGMSQRGGAVFSHVRFGGTVYSPVIPLGEADVLLSFEMMETLRWIDYVNQKNGKVIVVDLKIKPSTVDEYPDWVEDEIKKLPVDKVFLPEGLLKNSSGGVKFVNVAILGYISKFLPLKDEAWETAIVETVPAAFREENLRAFSAGKNLKI